MHTPWRPQDLGLSRHEWSDGRERGANCSFTYLRVNYVYYVVDGYLRECYGGVAPGPRATQPSRCTVLTLNKPNGPGRGPLAPFISSPITSILFAYLAEEYLKTHLILFGYGVIMNPRNLRRVEGEGKTESNCAYFLYYISTCFVLGTSHVKQVSLDTWSVLPTAPTPNYPSD